MATLETSLKEAMAVDGAIAAMLIDYRSGMPLGHVGDAAVVGGDLAAAGSTDVVRSQLRTMRALRMQDQIEDILITLGQTYHLMRLARHHDGMFLYLVVDRERANLAWARLQLERIEANLEF